MSISVTVPNSKIHLIKAAEFLSAMAGLAGSDTECCRCTETPAEGVVYDAYRPETFSGAHNDSLILSSADAAEVFGMSAEKSALPVPPTLQPGNIVTTPAGQVGMVPTEPSFVGLAMPPEPPTFPQVPAAPVEFKQEIPALPVVAPPTSPVAAPPVIISGVKLDGEGLPWDARIHAGTKTMRVSDNTWKLLKGVDKALVEKVKGELRVAMGLAMGPPATTPSTLTLVPPLPPASEAGWPDPPPGPAVIPGPPVPGPPASPPAPPAADPYPDFVQFCTSNQQSGRLQYQQIVDTCGKYGITQLPMLNARHDLIPTIRAELESLCKP